MESTARPDLRLTRALSDIRDGFLRRSLWLSLGWLEIKQRYRRSLIGPFWLTLSVGIFVGGLGIIYANLFNMEIRDYLPFLAIGFIVWSMLAQMMNEGCNVFIHSEGVIKQLTVPISVHVYRLVWRNLIVFAHNFVIFIVVMIYFGVSPGWTALLALPGLLLVAMTGFGAALTAGLLSARFRDIPPIITNVVQILFFVTPIMWKPETLTGRTFVVQGNPFYYLIEVVRAPLLGRVPAATEWLAAAAFALVSLVIALLLFVRFRGRIAYWL